MSEELPSCPLPWSDYDRIVLAHGGGGRLMQRLIGALFRRLFHDPELDRHHDGAVLATSPRTAVTTDAFTVHPLFFPGGDIGRLAVCGTVNDLAMCGARPTHMSVAFVLEEGLPLATLERITASMASTAREARVRIVTGDTKVVERGKGDGVFITTTGIGEIITPTRIDPGRVVPGDAIVVSGPVGDHGIAVMSRREGITFETELLSDVAPIAASALALVEAGIDVHCLRDPTRGGLTAVLAEIADAAGVHIRLRGDAIPVRPEVADACELLGLDPLYVACEGRFVAFVPADQTRRALSVLRANGCPQAAHIGDVHDTPARLVVLTTPTGSDRILDLLTGEQLPRIC